MIIDDYRQLRSVARTYGSRLNLERLPAAQATGDGALRLLAWKMRFAEFPGRAHLAYSSPARADLRTPDVESNKDPWTDFELIPGPLVIPGRVPRDSGLDDT